MKIISTVLTLFLLIANTILAAELQIETKGDDIIVSGNLGKLELKEHFLKKQFMQLNISGCGKTGEIGGPELPIYSKLINLPATGNYKLAEFSYDYDEMELYKKVIPFAWEDKIEPKNSYYDQDSWLPEKTCEIGKPNIMRGIRFSQLSFPAVMYNPQKNKLKVLKNIRIKLVMDYSDNRNPLSRSDVHITPSFAQIASEKIFNFSKERTISGESYLFIAPDDCAADLQPLLLLKNKLGYKTRLALLSETGSTNNAIKNYIQNAYDNWMNPPSYVVLIGDMNGSYSVPAFFVQGYYPPGSQDVTDHTYTLLEGDDYFPDVLLGRLSIRSLDQLRTIVNKIVKYQSDPFMGSNWFNKALMISYISDWGWGEPFYSARETKLAVREKLLDYNYAIVDTFFSPYQSSTYALKNKINEGYGFLNYRGAGGPGYWYEPFFAVDDVQSVNNGPQMPMITSITCGGGDFASPDYNSCLGETWLNIGNPSSPKGAIGFIGPSEHDTKTQFNNANDQGIYQGITQENLFRCGEMLLRGKMELYNCYPNNHTWGNSLNSDQFYFYVYNLLGDPGLQIWTDTPQTVAFTISNEINTTTNYLEIQVQNPTIAQDNFIVALTNDNELLAKGFTDASGQAILPVDLEAGTYTITLSKYGFKPESSEFTAQEKDKLSLLSYNFSNQPISGSNINLQLQIQNNNENSATNCEFALNTSSDDIEITNGTASITELPTLNTAQIDFSLELTPFWKNENPEGLTISANSSLGTQVFVINFDLISPELTFNSIQTGNADDILLQNADNELQIELQNTGNYTAGYVTAILLSRNSSSQVLDGNSYYTSILPGESQFNSYPFQIHIDDLVIGESIPLQLLLISDTDTLQILNFNLPVGNIVESSPTISGSYMALESNDTGNFTSPEFDWIETDPQYGGNGTFVGSDHTTYDGYVKFVDLPFTFSYFGIDYDTITICSEGWISMGETPIVFHRNRNIPSAAGAKAMIAPFWDSLTQGHVYYYYDEAQNYFVIQWSKTRNAYMSSYFETFECILYDPQHYETVNGDGMIKFQYQDIHNVDSGDNYATIGIENETQSAGLVLTYANIYPASVHDIASETAILITPKLDDNSSLNNDVIQNHAKLLYNYPNPFNPSTTIYFETTNLRDDTRLGIYNIRGQKIKELEVKDLKLGANKTIWNGKDEDDKAVSSGIYFYKLSSGKYHLSKKMILLK